MTGKDQAGPWSLCSRDKTGWLHCGPTPPPDSFKCLSTQPSFSSSRAFYLLFKHLLVLAGVMIAFSLKKKKSHMRFRMQRIPPCTQTQGKPREAARQDGSQNTSFLQLNRALCKVRLRKNGCACVFAFKQKPSLAE